MSAIQSFGIEISKKQTPLKRLSYEDFEIELLASKFTTTALILSGHPNKLIINKLKEFVNKFETKYRKELQEFYGNISIFEETKELIQDVFQDLISD